MESPRNENSQDDGPPIRDAEYYYEDGNCVFKIQGRLFKVRAKFSIILTSTYLLLVAQQQLHRFILTRDSILFEQEFLSSNTAPSSGSDCEEDKKDVQKPLIQGTDDNPITCEDTLEEFRALCWGLYAK